MGIRITIAMWYVHAIHTRDVPHGGSQVNHFLRVFLLRVAGRYLKDHIHSSTGQYLHPSTAPLEVGLMTSIGVLQATEPAGVPPHPPCEGGRGVEHHKRRVYFQHHFHLLTTTVGAIARRLRSPFAPRVCYPTREP